MTDRQGSYNVIHYTIMLRVPGSMYICPSSVWEPANAATVHDMSWDQSCFVTGRKRVVSWIIHSSDSLHFAKVCVTLLLIWFAGATRIWIQVFGSAMAYICFYATITVDT